jgi:hypothetical protein
VPHLRVRRFEIVGKHDETGQSEANTMRAPAFFNVLQA